ncbi:transcriptional regulator [Streptomyces sp. NPDC059578]|uniref:transcriptional regulator n=1 Tax=Streptomyces sp. NPDC059578 TaxID=3346874 RepID=UPI00369E2A36
MGNDQPTIEGVRRALSSGVDLFGEHRFEELSRVLPLILRDAEGLGGEGRQVRLRALQLTAGALVHTRQFDVAEVAIQRALNEATDRLECAPIISTQHWLLMRTGQLDAALDLAERWADEVEPRISRATVTELCTWGRLLLRVAAAAVRNNNSGQADHALRLARGVAATLGRECRVETENLSTFGPTTVRIKGTEHAVIADRPDVVLRMAENMPVYSVKPSASSRRRHRLDVACAHAKLGQHSEAVAELRNLQRVAPEWLRLQQYARDIVGLVVEGRRTLTPEMREVARAVRFER